MPFMTNEQGTSQWIEPTKVEVKFTRKVVNAQISPLVNVAMCEWVHMLDTTEEVPF